MKKIMEHNQSIPKPKHTLKDFMPLIIILSVIILFTLFMWNSSDNPDLMFGMRMFMFGFFLIFGAFKLIKWGGLCKGVQRIRYLS
jgi:hypothetical protein